MCKNSLPKIVKYSHICIYGLLKGEWNERKEGTKEERERKNEIGNGKESRQEIPWIM